MSSHVAISNIQLVKMILPTHLIMIDKRIDTTISGPKRETRWPNGDYESRPPVFDPPLLATNGANKKNAGRWSAKNGTVTLLIMVTRSCHVIWKISLFWWYHVICDTGGIFSRNLAPKVTMAGHVMDEHSDAALIAPTRLLWCFLALIWAVFGASWLYETDVGLKNCLSRTCGHVGCTRISAEVRGLQWCLFHFHGIIICRHWDNFPWPIFRFRK